MRKRYFFFDIDGTLAPDHSLVLPAGTVECLRQLRAAGHFIAIATGRLEADAARFAKRYGFQAVVADGGHSLSMDGKLIFRKELDHGACEQLAKELESKNIPWAVNVENDTTRVANSQRFVDIAGDSYFTTTVQPNLDIDQYPEIYKVFIACTAEEETEICFYGLPAVRFQPHQMFIEPVDKAAGIRQLMQKLHAPCEDVVVFGDGENDIKMFDKTWFSIAMGNACPALKAAADYVTGNCDDNGIWDACCYHHWV